VTWRPLSGLPDTSDPPTPLPVELIRRLSPVNRAAAGHRRRPCAVPCAGAGRGRGWRVCHEDPPGGLAEITPDRA